MANEKKDFKEWLQMLAVFLIGFVGIVTAASALNHAHGTGSTFITVCALADLAALCVGAYVAVRRILYGNLLNGKKDE